MSMVMNEMVDHYKGVRQRMADCLRAHYGVDPAIEPSRRAAPVEAEQASA